MRDRRPFAMGPVNKREVRRIELIPPEASVSEGFTYTRGTGQFANGGGELCRSFATAFVPSADFYCGGVGVARQDGSSLDDTGTPKRGVLLPSDRSEYLAASEWDDRGLPDDPAFLEFEFGGGVLLESGVTYWIGVEANAPSTSTADQMAVAVQSTADWRGDVGAAASASLRVGYTEPVGTYSLVDGESPVTSRSGYLYFGLLVIE